MKPRIVTAVVALACLGVLAACSDKPQSPRSGDPMSSAPGSAAARTPASMEILELRSGAGTPIARGQTAAVQYTGWLYESSAAGGKGRQFDSSLSTGQPLRFVVGAGQVIKGWDQGVPGMTVGARRRLTIPPELAYGDSGAGSVIPPGATLVFDVELVSIE